VIFEFKVFERKKGRKNVADVKGRMSSVQAGGGRILFEWWGQTKSLIFSQIGGEGLQAKSLNISTKKKGEKRKRVSNLGRERKESSMQKEKSSATRGGGRACA